VFKVIEVFELFKVSKGNVTIVLSAITLNSTDKGSFFDYLIEYS